MSDYSHQTIPRSQILAEWQATPDSAVSRYAEEWQQREALPRYLQALGAVGAFMAASMFLSFLGAIGIISFKEPLGMGIWGAVFAAAALYFSSRSEERMESFGDAFITQTTLILLAIGKILLIGAFAWQDNIHGWSSTWLWRVFAATAVVTAVTYPFSRFYIDRYVSSLATLMLFLACLLQDRFMTQATLDAPFNVYYLLLLAISAWFFARPHYPVMLRPMRDAVISALIALTVFVSVPMPFYKVLGYSLHPISIGLTIALLATTAWMAGGIVKVKGSPTLLLACAGIIGLGALAQPGILLAVCLMVLGYGRHERPLLINGAVSFAVFLWLFYYNLEMTLLAKSVLLAASGMLLLLARYYLHITRKKEA